MEVSECRLEVGEVEALLNGRPDALRQMATWVSDSAARREVELTGGGRVRVDRTESPLLSVTVGDRNNCVLVIAGAPSALGIIVDALNGLADCADELRTGPVQMHVHIEYLGEGDAWRDPGCFPLVISSDWPE